MTTTIAPFQDAAGWERALYAFLAEKERRSGSRRTVEGYARMLQHFFGTLGKPPDRIISQEVFVWAYGKGLSGKEPSTISIGTREADPAGGSRAQERPETDGSSGGSVRLVAWVATPMAADAIALGGATWYARRRRLWQGPPIRQT